ncbi:MAG: hypothetical protein K0R82_2165, partial [Flavipsychrobacter sp.]|nr:hypothetical protein [Flavipsychrobacter sp.]
MRLKSAILLTALMAISTPSVLFAQDDKTKQQKEEKDGSSEDLMDLLEEDEAAAAPKKEYVTSTFKSTRIINGHSIENTAKGVLDFRVSHRFGPVNSGLKDFFGLDGANTMIGFDYGVTDWLMVGLNRSTYQKEVAGLAKIKILRQAENNSMPVSVSYMGSVSAQTMPAPVPTPVVQGTDTIIPEYYFTNRLYFVNQLLIAHKFSNILSLQLMPTHIHYNLVPTRDEPNDVYALGLGGRVKLSNRMSLTGEYYYRFTELEGYHNSVSVGLDI